MAGAVDAKNGPVWALGMMSGTSLDGVDAALVQTDGTRIHAFGQSAYVDYTDDQRADLRAALGQWPGGPDVKTAAQVSEAAHIALARTLLAETSADLLGYHGQTLAHDPANGRTHQAGDGQTLADALKVPVVWDFRSKDVAEGGEGRTARPLLPPCLRAVHRGGCADCLLKPRGRGAMSHGSTRASMHPSAKRLSCF